MNSRIGQTLVGLGLATAIIGGWLSLHVWALFFQRWTGAAWFAAPLVIAFEGWFGAGMFIVAHDAIHGSLAPGRPKLNAAVGQVAVGLYAGFGLKKLASAHHQHHRTPGIVTDPDFHPVAGRGYLGWFFNFFRHYFGWPEFVRLTAVVAIYLFVLRASPLVVALFFGLPLFLSAVQLFTFGTYLPHREGQATFADRHRARTLDYPWLLSLVTCFHFGRHREHHAFPSVPWWRLPSVKLTQG